MSLFKRRKSNQDKFDYLYDEDGYFIGTSDDIYGLGDYYGNDNDSPPPRSRPRSPKRRPPKRQRPPKQPQPQVEQWDENYYDDYIDYDYAPDLYYDLDYDDRTIRQPVNIKVLTALLLYILFLLLGIFNTTFEDGYIPQIVNAEIKSQRVIYYKAMDKIKFLEELDDFKGIQELQELSESGHYQERIPPLQSSLKKVNRELESLQSRAYKIKETDYLKVEMMYMVNDLLVSEAETLKLAIQYYQQLSGYASPNTPQVQELQNRLLDQHNQYRNKLANYKVRFEQIRVNDLLLSD